jgi:hypothetical protein
MGRAAAVNMVAGLLLAALLVPASATAKVGGNHLFDPTLSLTGGTATSKLDPVPDPGPTHPAVAFTQPGGLALDSDGNIYVSNFGETIQNEHGEAETVNGRIDVFNPAGEFIVTIPDNNLPSRLAVDNDGSVYVRNFEGGTYAVWRYEPSEYPPTSTTTYGAPTQVSGNLEGMAVNRATDHLLVVTDQYVDEYGSAAEGTPLIRRVVPEGVFTGGNSIAVEASTGRIFVGARCTGCPYASNPSEPYDSSVFVFSKDGTLEEEIDGSDTPEGGFRASCGSQSMKTPANCSLMSLGKLVVSSAFSPKPAAATNTNQIPN